ncbi:galactitol-1-phosphate 5-dehydrogenase [Salmonella enterica subsp. enterica serovar Heidelberg]|nr:galactitol-1-phosphate 5-dehydrogenase [Salmonella enterica subsp. enterica serovar Heidelberg]
MKSVVIHAEGDVCVEERPLPQLQAEDDVLVKVVSSGLCGSDIPRIFAQGAHYYPITLGHEFSGYVESYGTGVTDMQPGDAVACVPLLPCFHCPQCERGYFSLCKQYQFVGSRSEGGNAEYVVVKRANLFRLPSDMPIEDGAFIEPITVGLHAFHLAQGCEGKNVIIVGAGTIGLLALQCARELGARSVTAIDINPQKLDMVLQATQAQRLGLRPDYGIDYQLLQAAREMSLPVQELEGAKHQLELLCDLPDGGMALLDDTLTHWHTNARLLQVMIGWWLEQPPTSVGASLPRTFSQPLYDVLMVKRNEAWRDALLALPPGRYVVAVGALHLYGEGNLPQILK